MKSDDEEKEEEVSRVSQSFPSMPGKQELKRKRGLWSEPED